ncbi:MAG TPA: hypothetical protein VJH24_02505 [Candidatus Bilamarchaeaceae archaeon]|nr:hypothetical protein [Candidatus Bilamarchaeaceae archaeon]
MPSWKEDIIRILKAFKNRRQKDLRKENDRLVKQAVLAFSVVDYEAALLSYVLAKIVSKPRFFRAEHITAIKEIEHQLVKLVRLPESAGEEDLKHYFVNIKKAIEQLEKKDPRFLTGLLNKGRLKIAATMYAQGISLGRASEMTDVNKQDILDYSGKTMMFDRLKEEKTIHERLKNARRLVA